MADLLDAPRRSLDRNANLRADCLGRYGNLQDRLPGHDGQRFAAFVGDFDLAQPLLQADRPESRLPGDFDRQRQRGIASRAEIAAQIDPGGRKTEGAIVRSVRPARYGPVSRSAHLEGPVGGERIQRQSGAVENLVERRPEWGVRVIDRQPHRRDCRPLLASGNDDLVARLGLDRPENLFQRESLPLERNLRLGRGRGRLLLLELDPDPSEPLLDFGRRRPAVRRQQVEHLWPLLNQCLFRCLAIRQLPRVQLPDEAANLEL